MDPVEALREFITARLTAAAGEIFTEFQLTVVKYRQGLHTQRRLLDISLETPINPQTTDELQQHFCREEQFWNKQQHSSLDQEPSQIKEKLLGVDRFGDTIMMTVGAQSKARENLDSHNSVREFINQRLTAAAGEIFTEFQHTIIQYQEEIQNQQRLLDVTLIPKMKFHRIDGPEQQRNSTLEHNEAEAPQIKEEEEEKPEALQIKEEKAEFYSSHDDEQLVVKQGADYFKMIPTSEQSQPVEPDSDSELLLFQDSGTGSQHQRTIHLINSESTHSSKGPHSCGICGKKVRCPSQLLEHMRIHSGEKPHPCEICGKRFSQHGSLLLHMRIHTGEKPHPCEICGKTFRVKSNLLVHMRTHTEEKPYSCETCGKTFSQHGNLLLHMRIHSGEKPHSCETCGKSFSQHGSLLVHMRIHSGEKPHSCVTCGKSFRAKSNLLVHMRIHTGEKPHLCVTCGKSFSQNSNLLVHMRTHSGEKP